MKRYKKVYLNHWATLTYPLWHYPTHPWNVTPYFSEQFPVLNVSEHQFPQWTKLNTSLKVRSPKVTRSKARLGCRPTFKSAKHFSNSKHKERKKNPLAQISFAGQKEKGVINQEVESISERSLAFDLVTRRKGQCTTHPRVPACSPSHGGDVTVYVCDINQPSLPTSFSSAVVSISVCLALSSVFHSINSPDNSPFSHSVLPVLSLRYWSFQLYISL